jgi:type II secretory pathway pseudopilin PulG
MMGLISARKRKGFTVLEESIVIVIIALLAIPLITLLNESIRAQVYGTKDVKGQYYANLIMQDFERRVRQAITNSITITTGNPYKVSFTYKKTDKDGKNPVPATYTYEIDNPNTANSIFYRQVDSNAKEVFPMGLEEGIIRNFVIVDENIDATNNDPPYYLTVQIETSAGTVLQKTIYLVNYYK